MTNRNIIEQNVIFKARYLCFYEHFKNRIGLILAQTIWRLDISSDREEAESDSWEGSCLDWTLTSRWCCLQPEPAQNVDGAIQLTESMGPRRKSTEPNIELKLLAFVGFIREVVIYYDQI